MTDQLRTRLLVAAQRFANEIADAIEEASGEREKPPSEAPARRRRGAPGTRGPRASAPVSEEALARADALLERGGLGRRTG